MVVGVRLAAEFVVQCRERLLGDCGPREQKVRDEETSGRRNYLSGRARMKRLVCGCSQSVVRPFEEKVWGHQGEMRGKCEA